MSRRSWLGLGPGLGPGPGFAKIRKAYPWMEWLQRRTWRNKLRSPRARYWLQVALVLGLVALIAFFLYNASVKMARQGMSLGFGFFAATSKFDIPFTLIDFDGSMSYGRAYWVGLLNTLLVAVIGIFFAAIVGFFVGLARMSSHFLIRQASQFFIEFFRNIPLLLQIIFWYFLLLESLPDVKDAWVFFNFLSMTIKGIFIPDISLQQGHVFWLGVALAMLSVFFWLVWSKRQQQKTGQMQPRLLVSLAILSIISATFWFFGNVSINLLRPELKSTGNISVLEGGIRVIPEFVALTVALILYTSTFLAECVRAGITSVSKGQREAASSLGFKKSLSLRLIIVPQALRVIIPPATNQFLNLTKNSSLAAAIGYPDLFNILAGTSLNQTGKAIEIIFVTMLSYLTISLSISLFMNWYNARWTLKT